MTASPNQTGWVRRVGPWLGIGTSPAALMMGGGVAEGLDGGRLVLAIVLGGVALCALAVAQGMLGQVRRLPVRELTWGPLGTEGSRRLASLAILAMMFGWFAVNVGVAGAATGQLLGIPERLGMIAFAALMLAITWRGIGALSWAALATAIATVVLAAWGLQLASTQHSLGFTSGQTASEPTTLLAGVSLVVGFGAAFALRTPDFTYALERRRQVLWCGLVGLLAPIVAFGLIGAALLAATGTWNLADVLTNLGSPTPAYLFLAIGFAGSVMTNLYSGALSLTDAAPRVSHETGLVVVAIGGTVAAASGFADHMIGYLVVMAIAAPALIVLCLIAWRGEPDRNRRWRTPGIGVWALSMAAGIAVYLIGSGAAPAASVTIAALLGFVAVGRVGQTSEPGSLTRRTYGDRHG